jgi:uncharacterized membrane protein YeiB
MYLEAVLLTGLFAFLLIFISEAYNKKLFGVAASLLMLILGLWIYTDGIQINTGSLEELQEERQGLAIATNTSNTTIETTTNTTLTSATTNTQTYSNLETPYMQFHVVLGFFMIALSIWGMFVYISQSYKAVSR